MMTPAIRSTLVAATSPNCCYRIAGGACAPALQGCLRRLDLSQPIVEHMSEDKV
jgi:hypothetical protein